MDAQKFSEHLEELIHAANSANVADWVAAVATAVTAIIAGVALAYARGQIKEAEKSRQLTRDLDIERSQPYVVVYTEPSAATNLAIDLVIKNFGPTAAKNVRVHLEPWPMRAGRDDESSRVGIPENLPVLAPGQEWRTSWEWGPCRIESDLPDRHEGTVRFDGLEGMPLQSPVVLDLGIYAAREWTEVRGVHDVAGALRDIRDTVKRWTEGQSGLSVYTRDGAKKDARMRELAEERRRRRQQQQATGEEN